MSSPRVLRGLLLLLVVLVLLATLAAVLVRRALDPESLRAMAEARLSAAVGAPVTVGKIDVSLFPSPRIDAREIRVGGQRTGAGPSLGLEAIQIVPRLSSILSKPVMIDRVEIQGLALDALRDEEGRWLLPFPRQAGAGANAQASANPAAAVDVGRVLLQNGRFTVTDAAAGARPARSANVRNISARLRLEGGVARVDDMKAVLGGSRLSGHGTASASGLRLSLAWDALVPADLPEVFALLDAAPPAGLAIEGEHPLTLDIAVDEQGKLTASGKLAASQMRLGTLGVTSLASPIQLSNNRLVLDPLTFAAYGGQQRGALSVDFGATPAAWSFRSAIEGVDVNRLLSANTSARDRLSGTARLRADLRGTSETPVDRTVAGTIVASVANGEVRDFPLVAALNSALRLTGSGDDQHLRFESLSATLHVGAAQVTTDDLQLRSGDLTLSAAGRMGFDQVLDLAGTARFSRAKSDELVRQVKDLGGLRNPGGELEVPFTVKGTVGAPAFSIEMGKILGRATQKELKRQIDRGLRKFIKIR